VSTFRTIVVAVDFSENSREAFRTAVQLAGELGASVQVVHVVSQSALRTCIQEGLFAPGDDDDIVRAKVKAHVDRQFDEFVAAEGAEAAQVERVVLRGDPARNLVEHIEERGGDLIVVGRRGQTLADVLLGSVAERVVRQASCPVLIVKRR
jgi:nucleotide-binding universal stress UspA family protein